MSLIYSPINVDVPKVEVEAQVEAPKVEVEAPKVEVEVKVEAEAEDFPSEDFPSEDFPSHSDAAEIAHDETGLFNPPPADVALGTSPDSHPGQ